MKKKSNLKPVAMSQSQSLVEKTEQILLTMPRMIAAQTGKDLVLLKQQAAKMKKDLSKAVQKKKTAIQRQIVLRKQKTAYAKTKAKNLQKLIQKPPFLLLPYSMLCRC